jgi:hypothetical protein
MLALASGVEHGANGRAIPPGEYFAEDSHSEAALSPMRVYGQAGTSFRQ